jgi:hypothetical protein
MPASLLLRGAGPQAAPGTAPAKVLRLARQPARQPAQAQVWFPPGEVEEEVQAVALVEESVSW